MTPELIRVSSGFAVVMAEAPDEAAEQESKVVPGTSYTSLCCYGLQRLIVSKHSGLDSSLPP